MQLDVDITSTSIVKEEGKQFVLYEFDVFDGNTHRKGF
jgi:hypothetical protein